MNLEKNLSAINSSVFSELSLKIISYLQSGEKSQLSKNGGGVLRMKRVKKSGFLMKFERKVCVILSSAFLV
ncbi:hypothetical protein [Campylobacter upsaliensis]|uniref:hypothetical protein n=1 Tax=Campylobacter upsaliensis TaxID=28080 RepID=UPI0022EB5503|nr:hypothetical protein [Campylobacter upsaliensis]